MFGKIFADINMVRLFVYLLLLIFSINIVHSTVEPAIAFELLEENSEDKNGHLNLKDVIHAELNLVDIHPHPTTIPKILNNYYIPFLVGILDFDEETPPPNQFA